MDELNNGQNVVPTLNCRFPSEIQGSISFLSSLFLPALVEAASFKIVVKSHRVTSLR